MYQHQLQQQRRNNQRMSYVALVALLKRSYQRMYRAYQTRISSGALAAACNAALAESSSAENFNVGGG